MGLEEAIVEVEVFMVLWAVPSGLIFGGDPNPDTNRFCFLPYSTLIRRAVSEVIIARRSTADWFKSNFLGDIVLPRPHGLS